MRIFAIGENSNQLLEFRDVFGMRFVGLVDNSGVYQAYRVPGPQAPYPQDYVIDQQGIVRYWSDQFDPQEVIRVIDRLLGPGVEQREQLGAPAHGDRLSVNPNPFRLRTSISLPAAEPNRVAVFDASGRLVRILTAPAASKSSSVSWDGTDEAGRRLPSGVYYARSSTGPAAPVLLLR